MSPVEPARFGSAAARRLAEKSMIEGLSPADARRLDRMIKASDRDREAYNQLGALFGAMERTDWLTEGQHLRILDAVQREVSGEAAVERKPTSWLWRLGPALAGALALALIVLLPALMKEKPPRDGPGSLQSRGVDSPGAPSARPSDVVDLRAWCIRDGVLIKQRPKVTPHHQDAECLLGDRLQMMITHTADYRHLLVIGHLRTADGQDKQLWYYPVPPTGRSGAAPARTEYAPLGQAIDLAVNHAPGQARVLAVFSHTPLDAEKLYRWLRDLPGTADAAERFKHRRGGADATAVEQRVQLFGRGP